MSVRLGLYCLGSIALVGSSARPISAQNATPATNSQQLQTASAASTSANSAAPATRVWTNDDLSGLHNSATLSTVGTNAKHPNGSGEAPLKSKAANSNYKAQIAKLEAQLPPIDSQIADLQAALSGNSVNTDRKYTGVKPDDWRLQLAQLEKKHDDIEIQIQALIDQARHAGVPANTLP
jgi:hypothetical protein